MPLGLEAKVFEARDKWIEQVINRNVLGVVALYAKDGVLLGTMDTGSPRKGHEAIEDYFEHFLDKDSIKAIFPDSGSDDYVVRQLAPKVYEYSGYYRFRLTKGEETKLACAKFSYIYQEGEKGLLLIVLHNSGLTPEGITAE